MLRISKRGRMAAISVAAAATGSGVAFAIPAMADSAGPTVSAVTVGGTSTIGAEMIVPIPGLAADWLAFGSVPQAVFTLSGGTVGDPALTGTNLAYGVGPVGVVDGSVDYVDDDTNLLVWSADGAGNISSSTASATAGITARGMVVGPDNLIYLTNNAGTILQYTPGASTTTSFTPTSGFLHGSTTANPESIAAASGSLWFTDDQGDLGSMSTAGAFAGPYDSGAFFAAHQGLATGGSRLWLISANQQSLESVSPSAPGTPTTVPLPDASPRITSVITGPDGNVWFTDPGDNAVGFVNVATQAVSEYPVPTGDVPLPTIGSGPTGSDSLVFGMTANHGNQVNLVGVITSPQPGTTSAPSTSTSTPTGPTTTASTPSTTASAPGTTPLGPTTTSSSPGSTHATTTTASPLPGVTSPAQARLSVVKTATVSTQRVASVTVSCAGSTCTGKLTLTASHRRSVTTRVKGKTKTVKKLVSVPVGSVRYSVGAGAVTTLKVKLTAATYRQLEAARTRRLKVTATATPTSSTAGSVTTGPVTLMGSKPASHTR